MSKKTILSITILIGILFFSWLLPNLSTKNKIIPSHVKVMLRDVGHQLLLSYKDTSSLVLPVKELGNNKYQLSFQNALALDPGNLVAIIDDKMKKSEIFTDYLVEVKDCAHQEVVYSFKVKNSEEKNIIPCKGRVLPKNCYFIEVKFHQSAGFFGWKTLLLSLSFLFFVGFQWYSKKKEIRIDENHINDNYTSIGIYTFYPEQNKLIKNAVEIPLSKKECELLEIFVKNANKVIKREELTKKVWEDHGVFVGRSLDTYISKLRKKLKDDTSIKLINVHGVGYKLEINV